MKRVRSAVVRLRMLYVQTPRARDECFAAFSLARMLEMLRYYLAERSSIKPRVYEVVPV